MPVTPLDTRFVPSGLRSVVFFPEKIRDKVENRVADIIVGLVLSAVVIAIGFLEPTLPERVINYLGALLSSRLLLALVAIIALLVLWIYLHRPRYSFVASLGMYKDKDGAYRCAKCDKTPLQTKESGWYCVKCHLLYDNPEFQRKRKEQQEAESRDEDATIRAYNESRRI